MKGFFIQFILILTFTSSLKSCKQSDKINLDISGEWIIENSEIVSFEMPDGCDSIDMGDTFNFKNDNRLIVKKSISDSKCIEYHYQIKDSVITFFSNDMVFEMKVIKISEENLILSYRGLPKIMLIEWKEEYNSMLQNGFEITFRKLQ
jgi:hypothetical protein